MVVVTHEMGFAATIGGQVAFLDHGRVLMSGGPQEVFGKPATPGSTSSSTPISIGAPRCWCEDAEVDPIRGTIGTLA